MIVSGHQISYIPWLPYFDKILKSDIFVVDDVSQFEKGGYSNRNVIKTPEGGQYLTIPVNLAEYKTKRLNQLKIANDLSWRRKHLRAIESAYGKARYFDKYQLNLAQLYEYSTENLSEFCRNFFEFILSEITINTKIVYASELKNTAGKKSDFVLSLCKNLGATSYYAGILGHNYLDIQKFKSCGIEVKFQDYKHKEYKQQFGGFLAGLSILDLMMNHGSESIKFI